MDKNIQEEYKARPWHFAAKGAAIVSGVFCVVIMVMLFYSLYTNRPGGKDSKDEVYSAELTALKTALKKNPQDETLKQKVREQDLKIRRDYFEHLNFRKRGGYYLLGGMVVFLLALKSLSTIRKNPPMPEPTEYDPEKEKSTARMGVIVLGLVVLGSALAVGSISITELVKKETPAPEVEVIEIKPPTPEELRKNWTRFRGPGGLGISVCKEAPLKWDVKSGEGILWKTEIPLNGYCSPVIWEDRIFLTGADKKTKEVYCYHRDTGEMLWKRKMNNAPGNSGFELQVWDDVMYAAPTGACDNQRVYVLFADGDAGAYDFEGKLLWSKNMGEPDNPYGNSTSLALYENLVLIQYDQGDMEDDQSFIYALDGSTGNEVWKTPRPVAGAWTSPIVIETEGGPQLITCSDPWVMGHNPLTGEEIWRADLMGPDIAPSPIYANGLVFVIQPYAALYAIKPDGKGDVTESHVAWVADCGAPDICSPVSNGELIFLVNTMGGVTCYDTKTGELVWEHELEMGFHSSPTLVGEWIYLQAEEGVHCIFKAARTFEEKERSDLGEIIKSTPAILDQKIYVRGEKHLFCIGEK